MRNLLHTRRLLLDGGMGTMLQGMGFSGNYDALNLTHPQAVKAVHERYLQAGADIIETNTFSSQRISQADYDLTEKCGEMAYEGAKIAKEVAEKYSTPDKPRFVVGSVGPTNRMASMSDDVNDAAARAVTFDELAAAYQEQMEGLIRGGVDAILIETIFDTLNAKAAIYAADEAMTTTGRDVPVMLSATVSDASGRMLAGQTVEAFAASVIHCRTLLSVGLNCGLGAKGLKPLVERLSEALPDVFISVHPNAGLPDEMGKYAQNAVDFAGEVREILPFVNIVGGCCGTTDEHIAKVAEIVDDTEVRKLRENDGIMTLSGLDVLKNTSKILCNIGERCNVAGSRKFLRLINGKSYDEAVQIARQQVEDGAQILDINMDDGLLDAPKEMSHFVNLLASEPDVARVPWMIDSSNWEVIRAALRNIQGKCVVNSISLKEGEAAFVEKARELRRFGAAVVVMAFDENGQATTCDRKIEICGRAYKILTESVRFPAEDIIFDPNVLSICTGMAEHDAYALDFIRATKWIRENLRGAHVSGGISNLSFAFRGNNKLREAMHAVFLYHAIRSGLDFAILNPASKVMYGDIPTDERRLLEAAVLHENSHAADDLIAFAQQNLEEKTDTSSNTSHNAIQLSVNERLINSIIKGDGGHLEEDLTEALKQFPHAVDIIEGPLMSGMNEVGRRFGNGEMFLPQVVKTARTMKQAVAILDPYIKQENVVGKSLRKTIILATVRGDVHDIGKNICGVVLSCNGYRVVDLGVMVEAEKIVEAVRREKADFIGLSGLITPSLIEMEKTVKALQDAGIRIPVFVGGATTSEKHTELKLRPIYEGEVIWTRDAGEMCGAISSK